MAGPSRSTGSASRCTRAPCSASWAPTEPARRRPCGSCSASPSRAPAAPRSTGMRTARFPTPWARSGPCSTAPAFTPGAGAEPPAGARAGAGLPAVEPTRRCAWSGSSGGRRRVKTYSLGMKQRLNLAAALLGDPRTLVLDEPANGLDPQGIRWLRDFLRSMASEGRTVLVSSHVLAEVAQTVDEVVVIHRGRLRAHSTLAELTRRREGDAVRVRSPDAARLAELLAPVAALGRGAGAGAARRPGRRPRAGGGPRRGARDQICTSSPRTPGRVARRRLPRTDQRPGGQVMQ